MHDVMQPQAASSLLTAQAPPPPFLQRYSDEELDSMLRELATYREFE